MAKELIRFRCYQCSKLLGTAASRAGKTTTCPNCKAELIVPEPDDPAKAELAEATRALVPNLEESPRVREPEDGPRHDPQFSWEEIDTAIFQTPGGPSPLDLPVSFAPPPVPESAPPAEPPLPPDPPAEPIAPAVQAPAVVEPPAPGPIPEIEVEIPLVRTDRPTRRRAGDVVLSQSVIASWAVFMLLALGISFVAGLFVGHFVWKGP